VATLELCANLLGLPPVGPLRAALPRRLHDPSRLTLVTASVMPQARAREGKNYLGHLHCFGQRPAEHPQAIVEQGARGGVMVISFHGRRIDTQLAATRDLERRRRHDDVLEQVAQGRRLAQVDPAEQGRIIGTGSALSSFVRITRFL
jgi:hypothetical protein